MPIRKENRFRCSAWTTWFHKTIFSKLLIKLPFIQCLYGIRSMRQTVKEIEVNVAYRWFLGLEMMDKVPHFSTFGKNYIPTVKNNISNTIPICPNNLTQYIYNPSYILIIKRQAKTLIIMCDFCLLDQWSTASFRFHLTIDTLAVQLYTSSLPRRIRDFHSTR